MKKFWKKTWKGFLFGAIFCALLGLLSWVFYPRNNTKEQGILFPDAYAFLTMPDNVVDVYVVGNSNIYSAFSPMELWGKYGYTSYVSGQPWQQTMQAVQVLNKFYEHQNPQIVILDVDEVFSSHYTPHDIMVAVRNAAIPVFEFHNNWKHLDLSRLTSPAKYTYTSPLMGQHVKTGIQGFKGKRDYMKSEDDGAAKIPVTAKKHLDEFMRICEEHGSQVILVNAPNPRTWNAKRHNTMQEYADKYGVPYLDYNVKQKEIKLDWSEDTGDGGSHLNVLGGIKFMGSLGKYLADNYSIPDSRDKEIASLYNQGMKKYREYCAESIENEKKAKEAAKKEEEEKALEKAEEDQAE